MSVPDGPIGNGSPNPQGEAGGDARPHIPPVAPPVTGGPADGPLLPPPVPAPAVTPAGGPPTPGTIPPPPLPHRPASSATPPATPPPPAASPYAALDREAPGPELGTPEDYEVPRRRWPWVVAGSILLVLLLAGAAYAMWTFVIGPALQNGGSGPAASVGATPVLPSGEASATTSSAAATTTSQVASTTPTATPAPSAKLPVDASKVAYRAEGAVWIADIDGQHRKRVVDSADGPFTLSPDGRRLAVSDSTSRHLLVADVATDIILDAGASEGTRPSWAPDSSFVVWTASRAGKPAIMRAGRDGELPFELRQGFAPQVSRDGKKVYFLQTTSTVELGPLASTSARQPNAHVDLVATGLVVDFALGNTALVYALGHDKGTLWRSDLAGGQAVRLLGPPTDPGAYRYARLYISPEGTRLAFARSGDDGFSRMSVMPLYGGGPAKDLSPRRDDYPVGWTPGGLRILFVAGNGLQQQRTDLMSVAPDGSSRDILVPGGGL